MQRNNIQFFGQCMDDFVTLLEKTNSGEKNPNVIETPFEFINSVIGGGLHRGSLTAIAGQPSMGKTLFAMHLAEHAVNTGGSALMFSANQSANQLVKRLIEMHSEVLSNRLWKMDDTKWQALSNAILEVSSLSMRFLINDTRLLSIDAISDGITAAKRSLREEGQPPLDMVLVDSVFELYSVPDNPYFSPYSSQAIQAPDHLPSLRNLARDHDIAMVITAPVMRQDLSRQNRKPRLTDISPKLELSSDLILTLYRDELYNPHTDFKGVIECTIWKNKWGGYGTGLLLFNDAPRRITDLRPADVEW